MSTGIPRDSVNEIPVRCPICHYHADSYPTGGSYAILDCTNCNGFYKITDTAVAVLEHQANWNAAARRLNKILKGVERGREWSIKDADSKMPVLVAMCGLTVKFRGKTWSVPIQ